MCGADVHRCTGYVHPIVSGLEEQPLCSVARRGADIKKGIVSACLAVTRAWSGWAVALRWLSAAAAAVQSTSRPGDLKASAQPSVDGTHSQNLVQVDSSQKYAVRLEL